VPDTVLSSFQAAADKISPELAAEALRNEEVKQLEKKITLYQALRAEYESYGDQNFKVMEIDKQILELETQKTTAMNASVSALVAQKEAVTKLSEAKALSIQQHKIDMLELADEENPSIDSELNRMKEVHDAKMVYLDMEAAAALRISKLTNNKDEAIAALDNYHELLRQKETEQKEFEKQLASEELNVIETKYRKGLVSAEEYAEAVRKAMKKMVIDHEAGTEKIIGATGTMFEQLKYGWDKAKEQAGSVGEQMIDLGAKLRTELVDGLADALMEVADGTKSLKEAMVDLGKSIVKMIAQATIKASITSLMGSIGLAEGGMVPGHSPTSKSDNIPIMATAKEFVQPVDSVKYYGAQVMEAMRRKLIPKELFESFSKGTGPLGALPQSVAKAKSSYASGGAVKGAGGNSFHVSVPVNVSGENLNTGFAARLQQGIEETVITIMRREFS